MMEKVKVIKRGESIKSVDLKGGAHFDLLFKNDTLEGILGTLGPGEGISDTYSHEGEEIHFVLSGEMEFEVEGKTYLLKEGDVIWYNSALHHTVRNNGVTTANFFSVVVPPTFM